MKAPFLPDIGCLAMAPIVFALAAAAAFAASPEPARELSTIEQQIDASKARQDEIASEIDSIGREAAGLSQKLIEVAETIQSREAAILSGEGRLKAIERETVMLKADLAGRRAQIAKLLAGLQLIEQNPPPALVVDPHDVLAALRGAMMFGTIVPELKAQAAQLSQELDRIETLHVRMAAEQDRLKDNLARLEDARKQLNALQARKKTLLAETGSRLEAEKARARELAAKAKDLQQLLASLERDRLKAEAETKAQAEQSAKTRAEAEADARRAQQLALRPRVAFADARGSLQYPAQGQIIKIFGADDNFGGKTRGVFVATRTEAQVVSPADGHVEFAGPFRSYGQLLILNAGGGYHVLLAGIGEITAEQGQFVRAGEPVGVMGKSAAPGTLASDQMQDGRPVLYIEFRKNGEAIDSAPWWIGGFAQARG